MTNPALIYRVDSLIRLVLIPKIPDLPFNFSANICVNWPRTPALELFPVLPVNLRVH